MTGTDPKPATAIPAIDLIDGHCVRLTQGSFNNKLIYPVDPVSLAQSYANSGAERLHIVDLDAVRGLPGNRQTIKKIRSVFPGKINAGGGIRSLEDAKSLIEIGIDYIVIGTILVKTPEKLEEWINNLGNVFIAGIDAREGLVKIAGWKEQTTLNATYLARKAAQTGITEIIYTDISRDGTLTGPNIPQSQSIATASGLPVIISGGVGNMAHIRKIAATSPGKITGVILGKALLEGKLKLPEVIQELGGSYEQ